MHLIRKEISVERFSSYLCVLWALLSSLKLPFALLKFTLLLDSSRMDQGLLLECQSPQCGYPSAEGWVESLDTGKTVLSSCLKQHRMEEINTKSIFGGK